MANPPDDRLTLEEQIIVAADARYGGFFCRRRFARVFHPHRVLALLHRVQDEDHALRTLEEGWCSQNEALDAQVTRVRALITKWRAEGDDLAAKELEEALGPPKDAASDSL